MRGTLPEPDAAYKSAQIGYFQDNTNAVGFFLQGELSPHGNASGRQLRISYEQLLKDPENTVALITSTAKVKYNEVGNIYSHDDVIAGMKGLPGSLTIGDHKLLRDNDRVQSGRHNEWKKLSLPGSLALSSTTASLARSLGYEVKIKGSPSCQSELAIIGMSCRFPGSVNSLADYWKVLKDGTQTSSHIPFNRWTLLVVAPTQSLARRRRCKPHLDHSLKILSTLITQHSTSLRPKRNPCLLSSVCCWNAHTWRF